MNYEQKLKLSEMINQNNTIDNTDEIKKLKHSKIIRENINNLVVLKKNTRDKKELNIKAQSECFFLFKNYTIIYNKLLKDDLDLSIMYKFLDVLETIENGKCDQHEASYTIGLLLKQIYIDKKINTDIEKNNNIKPINNISWNEYSKIVLKLN